MRKLFHAVVFGIVMLVASGSYATSIEGSTSGIFNNPVGPASMVTSGVGTDTFRWGTPSGTPSSSLNFSGAAISTDFNTLFSFGTLTYFNGTIVSGTGAEHVDLDVLLTLTSPTGVSETFTYNLDLINTTNSSDPIASADYVVLPGDQPDTHFAFGGVNYTLQFKGFGAITAGGFSEVNQFHVLEGQTASTQLIGVITPATVPEPGTMILLSSGLLGLAGFSRRRTKR